MSGPVGTDGALGFREVVRESWVEMDMVLKVVWGEVVLREGWEVYRGLVKRKSRMAVEEG